MFLAKIVREAKNETFSNEIFLWELDKEVGFCRGCKKPFSVSSRRHHCRNCGGIFCADCTVTGAEVEGIKVDRGCMGCIRGETPGENVRVAIEKSLSIFDTRASRKVTAYNVPLKYGSPFAENSGSSSPKASGVEAPTSGYFEFANKMSLFCCVKLVGGGDGGDVPTLWEVARPSYITVPPNGIISGQFDPSLPFVDLIVLMGNPHSPESDAVFDTSANPDSSISKCAAVRNFRRYLLFRIESAGKNVLLKYKGDTLVEPRLGNSVGRVGIFGKLGLKGEDKEHLNFDTNVASSAIRLFCASSV